MKIKETIERECCQVHDLKPFGTQPQPAPDYAFCKFCGKGFHLSEDKKIWNPLGFPWELSKSIEQLEDLVKKTQEQLKFQLDSTSTKAKKPRKSLKNGFSTGVI